MKTKHKLSQYAIFNVEAQMQSFTVMWFENVKLDK